MTRDILSSEGNKKKKKGGCRDKIKKDFTMDGGGSRSEIPCPSEGILFLLINIFFTLEKKKKKKKRSQNKIVQRGTKL